MIEKHAHICILYMHVIELNIMWLNMAAFFVCIEVPFLFQNYSTHCVMNGLNNSFHINNTGPTSYMHSMAAYWRCKTRGLMLKLYCSASVLFGSRQGSGAVQREGRERQLK